MNKRRLYAKTKTFPIFRRMFGSIVYRFEMDYWVLHCGNDGYLYLLLQRRLLKMTSYLSVMILVFSFAMNYKEHANKDAGMEYSLSALLDRATLSNRQLSNYRSWFHVVMVGIITFATIYTIKLTRRDARKSYEMYYAQMDQQLDSDWLKARTIHIKGIPQEDRTGNGLR